ncbi:MAG: 3,4-dihydroxy-2-butanone-4-phosphate synthase [Pseudomonadales bacterium]|nr:3,4-dihydroxy-2-butanone-4-phosphate synthase [Pseudomonadales bacterium]
MQLNTTEELIADIRAGKMVILVDDEDRENEGDIIMAAEHCGAEHINFMARFARGLICMPMSRERCERLGLSLMVQKNASGFGTKFTVSIEAATGVTTGISAADRARTVQVAAAKHAKATDIVQPGHIFPLIAEPGGVLSRTGHTEAACDLARLAGLEPAGVICEIMNDDGTMSRRPELEIFAKEHGLKIGTIANLIQYRLVNERTIEVAERSVIDTDFGEFELVVFKNTVDHEYHYALVKGDITPEEPTLVRVHLATAMRDIFCAQPPGMKIWNARRSLERIAAEGKGVLVLIHQCESIDELHNSALTMLGKKPLQITAASPNVHKTVGVGGQILRELNVGKMRVLGQPLRYRAISGYDLEVVEHIACE